MVGILEDAIREQMPELDSALAARQLEPIHRPLTAAKIFVEECIVSIEGDTKDDYLDKPWFSTIYQTIYDWYLKRYGDRLHHTAHSVATGIVACLGALFRLEVPLVIRTPADDPQQLWISFPDSVEASEDPLQWIEAPPNIDDLPADKRSNFLSDVSDTASCLRGLHRDFNAAILPSDDHRKMAVTIPAHLSAGASYVAQSRNPGNMAIWDWHMAAEKALKVYLHQRGSPPPNTHQLVTLYDLAVAASFEGIDRSAVERLPSGKEAVDYRYGQGAHHGPVDLAQLYKQYLHVCSAVGTRLERNLSVRGDTRFLIRVLPWARRSGA